MPSIDAHQHFWQYHPATHSWMNDEMKSIRRDFLPGDLHPLLVNQQITGCVAVQAAQTEAETGFLVTLSEKNPWIKGVVGWVDLCARDIEDRLAYWKQFPVVKGFRHILQAEHPDFLGQKSFINGISALQKHGFTYDILIYPRHLTATIALVKQFPQQRFVIDHLAKPEIKTGSLNEWAIGMVALSSFPNVFCKISGMVTEADWQHFTPADFHPYLDQVTESFGTGRLLYGSDWPVCLLATAYENQLAIVRNYFSSFSTDEKAAIMGENAALFYQLPG